MKPKLHPQMLQILTTLFPDDDPYVKYQHMSNVSKSIVKHLEYLGKKDTDTVSVPSIQLTSKEG